MEKKSNIGAAILAGGKSSRFGHDNKALAKINDVTLIEHVYNQLSPIFDEIIIVGNGYDKISTLKNVSFVSDEFKNIGPLGGIHIALKSCKNKTLFIVSCDMPLLNRELVLSLQQSFIDSDADVLVPKIDDKIEPLHGFYSKHIFEPLDSYLKAASSFKILNFLDQIKTTYFSLPNNNAIKKSFLNINTKEDLEKLLKTNNRDIQK